MATVDRDDIQHCEDVAVAKTRLDPPLLQEPLLDGAGAQGQHLQRSGSVQHHVVEAVDDGHPAAADDALDRVAVDDIAWSQLRHVGPAPTQRSFRVRPTTPVPADTAATATAAVWRRLVFTRRSSRPGSPGAVSEWAW